jgi:hypothetical protein
MSTFNSLMAFSKAVDSTELFHNEVRFNPRHDITIKKIDAVLCLDPRRVKSYLPRIQWMRYRHFDKLQPNAKM